MNFIAYVITNNATGKQYVGITTRCVAKRWQQHVNQRGNKKGKLARAIIKYGKDQFTIFHVASAWSKESLYDLEKALISQFDTFANGYNATLGGEGGSGHKHTAETRATISRKKIGVKATEEQRKNMSLSRLGVKHSAERKRHRSEVATKQYGKDGYSQLKRATAIRVERARKDRESGITAKPKGALAPTKTRIGTQAIRSMESRLRMQMARQKFIAMNGFAASERAGKISSKDAAEIKWLLTNSDWKQSHIGALYGIGCTQISNISTGRVWKGVSPTIPAQG